MNKGKYVFSQITDCLPKRVFDGIVARYEGDKWVKGFTCWNQLLVLVYGQLAACDSLRELVCIISSIKNRCYGLEFGGKVVKLSSLSYANANRDYRMFEEFAYRMIDIAQKKRADEPFELAGRFYAFDSTTIRLCQSVFEWAFFRKTTSGVKISTMFDIVAQIPTFIHITEARMHDIKAMDLIPYEPNAFYIFDKGYFDLSRLYTINIIGSYFIIRQKARLKYEIVDGDDNVLLDQTIVLTGPSRRKYPARLRRIVYYAPDLKRTFTYLTNNFSFKAKDIAMLYKQRWQIELFFKWMKQHLKITSFWGTTENAVRIQIYVAVITYCLIAIVEHDYKLNRTPFNVLRVVSRYLADKTPIRDLFDGSETLEDSMCEYGYQLKFNFSF